MKYARLFHSVLLAPLLAFAAPAQDSPFFRGPNRDGTYPSATVRTDWQAQPPRVLWRRDVGYGFSQVAVAGTRAVTAGYDPAAKKSLLYCLDAETGKEIWKIEYADACGGYREQLIGPVATPAIENGRVYAVAVMGALYAFDLASGQKVWERVTNPAPSPRFGDYGDGVSPVILGDRILVHLTASATNAAWFAVNKADGAVLWNHPVERRQPAGRQDRADRAYSSAVPVTWQGKPHVILVSNASVDLVSLTDGARVFSHSLADLRMNWGPFPDPALFEGDKFLLGTWYGGRTHAILFHLKADGIGRAWSNKSIGYGAYSFVLRGGFAYGYGADGLQCVALADGDVKWEWRPSDSKRKLDQGEPILVGDKLVWLTTSGMLYVGEASPEKSGPLGEFRAIGPCTRDLKADKARYNATISTPPSFAAGRIYCRAPWGDVVCVDVR